MNEEMNRMMHGRLSCNLIRTVAIFLFALISMRPGLAQDGRPYHPVIGRRVIDSIQNLLIAKCAAGQQERIKKGTKQVALAWQEADGSEEQLKNFCLNNFIVNEHELRENFERITHNLMVLQGNLRKIRACMNESSDFDGIEQLKADAYFRKTEPVTDAYKTKLAFFIKLNFPSYSFREKKIEGPGWSRQQWAMVRLGDEFAGRKKTGTNNPYSDSVRAFDEYMQHYFIRMDHVSMPDGSFCFSKETVLHSHRGLRDEIKDEYSIPGGKKRQELLDCVMERIITGTIPAEFRSDTATRWDPWTNRLYRQKTGRMEQIPFTPEGTRRYEGLRAVFRSEYFRDQQLIPESTYIQRTFEKHNLTVEEVEKLIRGFLSSPLLNQARKLIEERLGRLLEPFDLWYSGFQDQSVFRAEMLDSLVSRRYPDAAAFQKDLPDILTRIGFTAKEAIRLGRQIRVRPIPSGGYSIRPAFPDEDVVMTTMFAKSGMDYKAYRVAIHELGHAVEMLYTRDEASNYFLADVPSNGITEGVAELFAYRNIVGLGLRVDANLQHYMQSLATLWYLYEMGGQALTDIETWKWMYAHPRADAAALRAAVLEISAGIWNTYYAGLFGVRDQHILSIYNHFITGSLYLFNYFYSNIIMYQLYHDFGSAHLEERLKEACREGKTLPELWMKHAVNESISFRALLDDAGKAVSFYEQRIHGETPGK